MHANELCISKLLLTNRLINTILLNLSIYDAFDNSNGSQGSDFKDKIWFQQFTRTMLFQAYILSPLRTFSHNF